MEDMTLAKACFQFMKVPGETLKDFTPGFRELTDKDREDLKADFAKLGVNITNV